MGFEEEPMEEEKKKPKPVEVRVVGTKGKSSLVEYGMERGYVPASSVRDGKISAVMLKRAVPYGVPWEKLDGGLGEDLKKAGIWTKEDLSRDQRTVWELAKAHKVDLAAVNAFAAKEG